MAKCPKRVYYNKDSLEIGVICLFQYTIYTVPDEEIYRRQCQALEKHIPGLEKMYDLEDVDGSRISIYKKDGSEIKVANDYQVGGVFVDSEIDLLPFFSK